MSNLDENRKVVYVDTLMYLIDAIYVIPNKDQVKQILEKIHDARSENS